MADGFQLVGANSDTQPEALPAVIGELQEFFRD